MKDLSKDLEEAITNAIDVMGFSVDVTEVKSEKLAALMQSKIDSFTYTKELIISWQNSQNSPSKEKLKAYIERLVKAGNNSIETLRQALRKKIDVDDVDPEKLGQAVKAKPVIFKAIAEINSGVYQLQAQLDADKFDLKNREFSRGMPEKFANQEFYPLKNYHKEWYDKETESIIICPLGTKGEIINLDGLKIMLPARPKNKKNILFHRLPKEEQFWRRQPVPSGLSPDTEEQYIEYIMEEFRRRREGVWFYNNGEPVYLTGAHYFALQWCMLKDDRYVGYMAYRHAQRNMFYHTEACVLDPRCLGQFFTKSRRTGYTYEKIFRMLHEATSTKNANFGITSKSDEDAKKAFKKLSYAFLNLPFFFRPVVKSKEDSDVKLEFAKPSSNSKLSKISRDTNTGDYLNTTIDYEPTKEDAYDGQAMYRYLADEASKWKRGLNFLKHWGEVSPTLDEGGHVVGKAFVGSTVAAMKDGGDAFLKIYDQSDLLKRDPTTGRTPSGLYPYFLPAHENMTRFTDRYGVCHKIVEKGESFVNEKGDIQFVGAVQFLEAKRASKKKEGMIDYNNELRAFPMTIDDAFRDEVTEQLFDIEKINAQLKYNREIKIDDKLVRGNFHWKNNEPDTEVIWRPEERGRFLVYWLPPEDMRNKFVMKPTPFGLGGLCKFPVHGEVGAFGCDPYDQVAVVDSKLISTENGTEYNLGSKGSLHGLTGFNLGDLPNNTFFLEYIARPKDSEMFFEDVLMACVFYSMPILVENNKKMLLEHILRRGYRGYSINRTDKDMNRLSPDEKKLGGIPNNSPDIINRHWTGIESYVNNHVGEYVHEGNGARMREEGEIGDMPFVRTLSDWLKFNIKDRTKFDASISSGLAIMAVNRNNFKKVEEKKPFVLSIKKYDNYAGRR